MAGVHHQAQTAGYRLTTRPSWLDWPVFAAEVASDRIPELLGKIERLRAVLWARLTIRGRSPKPAADRNGECES